MGVSTSSAVSVSPHRLDNKWLEVVKSDSRGKNSFVCFQVLTWARTEKRKTNKNPKLKSKEFTHRWRPQCSPQCSHPTGTFQMVPSSFPCSCTWQRCIARPGRGHSNVSSIFSTRLCPKRTSTWNSEWEVKRSISQPIYHIRVGSKKPATRNIRPYRFAF